MSEQVETVTEQPPKPCLHCGKTVAAPRRRGQRKDFCNDRCRGAYHLEKRRGALGDAVRRLVEVEQEIGALRDELVAECDRLTAVVRGTVREIEATIGSPRERGRSS